MKLIKSEHYLFIEVIDLFVQYFEAGTKLCAQLEEFGDSVLLSGHVTSNAQKLHFHVVNGSLAPEVFFRRALFVAQRGALESLHQPRYIRLRSWGSSLCIWRRLCSDLGWCYGCLGWCVVWNYGMRYRNGKVFWRLRHLGICSVHFFL